MICVAQPDDLEAVREIFREYAAWVGSPICFSSFEIELAELPARYQALFIDNQADGIAACAAFRKLDDTTGEMKRLYVRPAFRGRGLGRSLIEHVIAEARRSGCERLRLDTLPVMEQAGTLYRELGFREIPPYGDNPPEAICFELSL